MRIPKTFGERTGEKRKANKKYYLIFEGAKTEAQYFNGIASNKEFLNISSLIEIIPVLRSYNEEDWSNPKKILDKFIEYIGAKEEASLTAGAFLDKIIDWLLEEQIISDNGIYNRYNLKDECIKLFENEAVTVILEEAIEIMAEFLAKELNISNAVKQVDEYIKRQFVTYEAGYDKICLIVDRDRQSFKEEQYDYVVETCKEKGYGFYVSNPCFEFWLLLHYEEVLQMDRDILLKNPKETPKSKKRFLEKQLSALMEGYTKNNLRFDKIADKVFKAIEHEKYFCENINGLKTDLGCNIGLLVKEMQIT
mgnify:CR=1 FL=1